MKAIVANEIMKALRAAKRHADFRVKGKRKLTKAQSNKLKKDIDKELAKRPK